MALTEKLTAIADAIRAKTGQSDKLTLDDMPVQIEGLSVSEIIAHAEIPDYVKEAALEVARKVQAVRTDDSIVFLAMSDFHHAGDQVDSWQENINTGNLHAAQAAKILAYALKFDFMCHLGDLTFGSKDTTPALLEAQVGQINDYLAEAFQGIPQLRTPGNHDTGEYRVAETGDLSDFTGAEKLFSLFGSYCAGAVYGSEEYGYCYLDLEDRKLRIICLNTSEGETYFEGDYSDYVASPAQRLWFAQTLAGMGSKEDGAQWSVVVLSHYPLDYGGTYPLSAIVKAYVKGGSVTENSTAVDFSGKNAAKFVANFHGHTHCFKYAKLNTISGGAGTEYDAWRVAVPNCCFYRENQYAGSPVYGIDFGEDTSYSKTVGTASDTAFVVNVIDPSEQVIHSFCYGAGYDRVIGYAATVYYSINKTLTNATVSSDVTSVKEGEAYTATVSADDGYELSSVTITMGGVDVTDSVYSGGTISIGAVTGNVVITVKAVKQVNYTNLVALAVDSSGESAPYEDGYYLSSSGSASAMSGFTTTGFMPVDGAAVHTYRIGGDGISWNVYGARIAWYDASFAQKGDVMSYDKIGSGTYYPTTVEDDTAAAAFATHANVVPSNGAAYFRVSAKGSGENLIVTIDEAIE